MTTKTASPQETEREKETLPGATGSSSANLVRVLLAAATPLFKRMISSAFAIRLGTLRDEEIADEPIVDEIDQVEPGAKAQSIKRFDTHQRIQHVLMFTSFITLAFTGLPQKFHAFGPSVWLIAALGGIEMTQSIHRVAAAVMLFDCVYHVLYIVHGIMRKKDINPFRMIPGPKDISDGVQMFMYFLGFTQKQPKFDRYSYLEKFDYWAVFWGIFIIGGSGIVLLFPVQVAMVLPGQLIPVALAAHSDEAVLAISWIFAVHLFYAHLAPKIFPFNTSIFSGKVSGERYEEEHPLDYRRIMIAERRQRIKEGVPPAPMPVSGGAPDEAPEHDTAAAESGPMETTIR